MDYLNRSAKGYYVFSHTKSLLHAAWDFLWQAQRFLNVAPKNVSLHQNVLGHCPCPYNHVQQPPHFLFLQFLPNCVQSKDETRQKLKGKHLHTNNWLVMQALKILLKTSFVKA